MKIKNKEESISFWDRNANKWEDMAYNKCGDYTRFPTSEQRGNIVINEIKINSNNNNASILDIGCANGDLLMSLIDTGYLNVTGLDNSKSMIDEARKVLKSKYENLNSCDIFNVQDADYLDLHCKYDFISAMGLIEYLTDLDSFFLKIHNHLNDTGVMLIESRNKLFNLSSANTYTLDSDIDVLLRELESSKKYSQITDDHEVKTIIANIYNGINIDNSLINIDSNEKPPEEYPFNLPQYSPSELNKILEKNGLTIRHVIYYHAHPFPPIFQNSIGAVFNKLADAMQPLGYTPIGSTMFSSFVAIVEKL
jgi:2-polyprenyl-3-methyl-5-hydroxy-6-metoxy-1,4-benzoquinol methylase